MLQDRQYFIFHLDGIGSLNRRFLPSPSWPIVSTWRRYSHYYYVHFLCDFNNCPYNEKAEMRLPMKRILLLLISLFTWDYRANESFRKHDLTKTPKTVFWLPSPKMLILKPWLGILGNIPGTGNNLSILRLPFSFWYNRTLCPSRGTLRNDCNRLSNKRTNILWLFAVDQIDNYLSMDDWESFNWNLLIFSEWRARLHFIGTLMDGQRETKEEKEVREKRLPEKNETTTDCFTFACSDHLIKSHDPAVQAVNDIHLNVRLFLLVASCLHVMRGCFATILMLARLELLMAP